jgi:hypothetical protein
MAHNEKIIMNFRILRRDLGLIYSAKNIPGETEEKNISQDSGFGAEI